MVAPTALCKYDSNSGATVSPHVRRLRRFPGFLVHAERASEHSHHSLPLTWF